MHPIPPWQTAPRWIVGLAVVCVNAEPGVVAWRFCAKDTTQAAESGAQLRRLADEAREKLAPFHWWIEFPEVFFEERPDPLQSGARNGAALMEGAPPMIANPWFVSEP